MKSALRSLVVVAALIPAAVPSAADPAPSGMSPAVANVGQAVTVSGTGLSKTGYNVTVEFKKKYRSAGEALVASITPTSATASAVTFPAPSNAVPNSFLLRYKLAPSTTASTSSSGSTLTLSSTLKPTNLTVKPNLNLASLQNPGHAIPGELHVRETPVISSVNTGLYITSENQTARFFAPGAGATYEIRGRNLVPPPGGTTTFKIGTTTYSQPSPARYDTTSLGRDILTVQIPEPPASFRGAAVVTTPGGTCSEPDWVVVRRPRVTAVELLNGNGTVAGPAGGILQRGRRYQLRGTEFAFPAAAPFEQTSSATVGGTPAAFNQTVDATRHVLEVPASLNGNTAAVNLSSFGGSVNAGTFQLGDPGTPPPPLAGLVVSPSPTVRGSSVNAVLSFAGNVPAGADLGGVEISSSGSDQFVGLPKVVPITSNPMTIPLQAYVHDEVGTVQVRARLKRLTAGTNELTSTVQLSAPQITEMAFDQPTMGGGSITTLRVTLDVPEGAQTESCGGLFSDPDAAIRIESSDPSAATFFNSRPELGSRACVEGRVTEIDIHTEVVAQTRTVTFTATCGNSSRTATLTLLPPQLNGVTINRTALTAMQSATGTLALSSPMSGSFALLSSSDPAVSVPAKLTFGTSPNLNFQITTLPVSSARAVTVSAIVNGVTKTATIDLNPLQFQSLTLSPASVRGGSNVAATLALNATIDLPFTVALSTSDPAVATVPASVPFAAGQNAAVFSVQTVGGQAQNREVTITATHTITLPNGTSVTTTRSSVLTVTP